MTMPRISSKISKIAKEVIPGYAFYLHDTKSKKHKTSFLSSVEKKATKNISDKRIKL